MNRPTTLIPVFVVVVFAGFAFWLAAHWIARAQSKESKSQATQIEPYAQLDEKASAVKGADEKAIRELSDAVFQLVTGDQDPSLFVSPYKERLVRAEINYRSGQTAGIPEANVVRVIDELARTFDAPEYARTDEDEVRETRLSLSSGMPHFIPHQSTGTGAVSSTEPPYTINSVMSPLEALYVMRFLIMQKEINPWSQTTPAERTEVKARVNQLGEKGFQLNLRQRGEVRTALIEQKLYPERPQLTAEELATRLQQQKAEQSRFVLMSRPSSARDAEMQEVFRRASKMKLTDAIVLVNKSLDLLGIEN
jgi:hypothetical protein